MIAREEYLSKIKSAMWDGNIKVITGLRKSGKSTLLFELFYEYLISTGVQEENIIKLELDKIKYFVFRNPIALCDEEKATSELDSFVLTGNFYKKIVIRDDIPHHFYDENGFLHCSLLDFLMNRVELF